MAREYLNEFGPNQICKPSSNRPKLSFVPCELSGSIKYCLNLNRIPCFLEAGFARGVIWSAREKTNAKLCHTHLIISFKGPVYSVE